MLLSMLRLTSRVLDVLQDSHRRVSTAVRLALALFPAREQHRVVPATDRSSLTAFTSLVVATRMSGSASRTDSGEMPPSCHSVRAVSGYASLNVTGHAKT